MHTEFYDPIVLEAGESVYIDSNMGHAYIAAEGCDEALLLGVCSSADEQPDGIAADPAREDRSGQAEHPRHGTPMRKR